MKKHRNRQKRIVFQDAIYFVTAKTHDNLPYFQERIFCDLLVENLRFCKQLKGFLLYGWVLAYDHFHLLVQPSHEYNISKVMQFLKRHVSRNVNIVLGYTQLLPKSEGRIGQSGLRGTDQSGLRGTDQSGLRNKIENIKKRKPIIQIIFKFDVFVRILATRFRFKYFNGHIFPKFQWQESFHDHYIRNDWDFNDKMDYIAWNPTKHKLPADWTYVYTNPNYENLIDEN